MKISTRSLLRMISYWPPFLAAGIKVENFREDFTHIRVRLKSSFWNKNYFGTHFGGSLFSMADPFYLFILIEKLGDDHILWDKTSEIDFLKATHETVYADFHISAKEIESIRKQALTKFKVIYTFYAEIKNENGEVIAKIKKDLYIRRKDAKDRFSKIS
ncbi:MAG: DUF4442 domain-containing protein [Oligoflexales bacterium]